MVKKMKKILVIFTAAILTLSAFSFSAALPVKAEGVACSTVEDCEAKKQELANQKATIKNEIEVAKADVSKQYDALYKIGAQRSVLESEISVLQESISLLAVREVELGQEVDIKEGKVKKRLTVMQRQNNKHTFFTLLANSTSVADLMKRWTALEIINSQDKKLMNELLTLKESLENSRKQQEIDKTELDASKQAILSIEAEEEAQLQQVAKKQAELEGQMVDIVLSESEVQGQQDAAQAYKDELARQEEQRKKDEEEKNKQPETPNPGDGGGGETPPETEKPEEPAPTPDPPVQATWHLPAAKGWVSCTMWCYPNHIGTDFAMPEWTQVYSVANGRVIYTSTGYSGGFGNMIVIYHYINGVDYVTIYAHLNEINISVGQTVSGGQLIGHSGNTGASEGPHLHLELLRNIDYYPGSKSTRIQHAVSILDYVPGSWKWNW